MHVVGCAHVKCSGVACPVWCAADTAELDNNLVMLDMVFRTLEERTMEGSPCMLPATNQPPGAGGPLFSTTGKLLLNQDLARALLGVVQTQLPGLGMDSIKNAARIQAQVVKAFPGLALSSGPAVLEVFPSEVEEETAGHFKALFKGSVQQGELVQRMQQYKGSRSTREQQVFACMVHHLLDEYRFLLRYPPNEVTIMSSMFGRVIASGLLDSITLGVALRYLLDGLGKSPPNKLFTFAMDALKQCVSTVASWQLLAMQVLQATPLREADADLHARLLAAYEDRRASLPRVMVTTINAVQQGVHPLGAVQPENNFAVGSGGVNSLGGAPRAGAPTTSRFLTLQPAAPTPETPTAGAAGTNNSFSRDPVTSNPADTLKEAQAAAAAAAAQDDVSKGESLEDGVEGLLATEVASGALSAPNPKDGPSLTSLVNTESLESAAEKFVKQERIRKPVEAVTDK